MQNGIWVFCENAPEGIRGVSYELLGEAARLARGANLSVTAVALGTNRPVEEICARGADDVLLVEDEALNEPEEMRYTQEICALAQKYGPEILLLGGTMFGRSLAPRIVAIGGNEKNAYLSGINVDLYKVITYAIAGVIVAGASLILGARLNSITATAGDGYETDALVAAVVGGVTFEGGRGTVSGAFLGCLLTGIISNAMDILGVHAYVKTVITGAIIVGAVVMSNMDKLRKKV